MLPVGVGSELGVIRRAIQEFKPDIAFNLLEAFADVATWDQNVVAYLELHAGARTPAATRAGCCSPATRPSPRRSSPTTGSPVAGLRGRSRGAARSGGRAGCAFPLIVKSLTLDASIGISQASVVEDDAKLEERVRFIHESIGTDALVEEYVEGRELYVGVLGNERLQVLPIWELDFSGLPEEARRIATERLKWSLSYQKKHSIATGPAKDLRGAAGEDGSASCASASTAASMLSGYARIDLRLRDDGRVVVLEANPNPQLAYGEDFAEAAENAGIHYGPLLERIMALGLRLGARVPGVAAEAHSARSTSSGRPAPDLGAAGETDRDRERQHRRARAPSSSGRGSANAPSNTKRTSAQPAAVESSERGERPASAPEHRVLGEQDAEELRPPGAERAQQRALAHALVAARRHRAGQHHRPRGEAEQRHEADGEHHLVEDALDRALDLGEVEGRDVGVRLDHLALQAGPRRRGSSTRASST